MVTETRSKSKAEALKEVVAVLTAGSFDGMYGNLTGQAKFQFFQVVDLGEMKGRCYCKHPIRYEFWVKPVDRPLEEIIPEFEADNPAVRDGCLVVGSSCIEKILGVDGNEAAELIRLYREAVAIRDEIATLDAEQPDWRKRNEFLQAAWPAVEGDLPLPLRRLGSLLNEAELPFPEVLLDAVKEHWGRQQIDKIRSYLARWLRTGLKSQLFDSFYDQLRGGHALSGKQMAVLMRVTEQCPDPELAAAEITLQRQRLLRAWRIVNERDQPFIASLLKRVNGTDYVPLPLTDPQIGALNAMARRYAESDPKSRAD